MNKVTVTIKKLSPEELDTIKDGLLNLTDKFYDHNIYGLTELEHNILYEAKKIVADIYMQEKYGDPNNRGRRMRRIP